MERPLDAAKAARTEALKDRKALKADLRRLEREVARLEQDISRLEIDQRELHQRLASSETSAEDRAEAGRKLKGLEEDLAARLVEWEEAGKRRDSLAALA